MRYYTNSNTTKINQSQEPSLLSQVPISGEKQLFTVNCLAQARVAGTLLMSRPRLKAKLC